MLKFRYASAKIAANPIRPKAYIKYLKITSSPLKSLIMKQAIPQGKQNRITMFARCIINLRILTNTSSPSGLALILFVQTIYPWLIFLHANHLYYQTSARRIKELVGLEFYSYGVFIFVGGGKKNVVRRNNNNKNNNNNNNIIIN